MLIPTDDKIALTIFAKYDETRDLNLETCESFRQYYRDNPQKLRYAIDNCSCEEAQDALHLLVCCEDARDAVRRAMTIVMPPDDLTGEVLF